jgi:hypothetical protein
VIEDPQRTGRRAVDDQRQLVGHAVPPVIGQMGAAWRSAERLRRASVL